jgi:hypothetical protein
VYASIRAFRGAHLLRLSNLVSRFDREWKLDAATRSLDCRFVEEDATADAIDDEPGNGEPQSGSTVRGDLVDGTGEEAFENAEMFARGNTGT